MIHFLITSTICLTVFLGFYHLFLEKEKMHFFNRFYLLSSIIVSLFIPFLNFEIIKEIPATVSQNIVFDEFTSNQIIFAEQKTSVLPLVLWILYGLTAFGFFIRFGKNIFELILKIRKNPSVKYKNAQLVLVDEKTIPHTFWNSIFINFDDYNRQKIEDELYTHELVHATQKHTFDILFIETLKTVFWFNPLFYFYKKAIQLNHEFLADEEVIKSCDVPFYQTLLLQKNSIDHIFLTSNLNYLVTKKRLIMMTKNTSKTLALLKKAAIIPVISGLIYFFCVEIVAQEKVIPNKTTKSEGKIVANATTKTEKNKNVSEDDYFKGIRIKYYENENGKLIFDKKYEELTESEKHEIQISLMLSMQKPLERKSPSQQELNEFKNAAKYAIWIDGKNVSNNELNNYKPKDFAHYSGSSVLKNARTKKHPQPFQYWFYTHSYYEKNNMGKQINKYPGEEIVIFKDGKNRYISPTEKTAVRAEDFPPMPPMPPTPNKQVSFGKVSDYMEKNKQEGIIMPVVVGKYGETQTSKKNKNENLEVVALGTETDLEIPTFPGGLSEFYKYVAKNFKMPKGFKSKDKLIVSFIVEKDGSLTNINVKQDLGFGTKEEAIRVLKNSPKWIPATANKEEVRYQYVLPIQIASE
ncbi:MAG: M56 family metallopeptidase [Flavobacteriaceae bacterium]|jgi:beta-lactamase regulating signal transducer with metallopeptidase domain|nr:M56 family metallopeptidase [Flavobacteriaceae bacterium]